MMPRKYLSIGMFPGLEYSLDNFTPQVTANLIRTSCLVLLVSHTRAREILQRLLGLKDLHDVLARELRATGCLVQGLVIEIDHPGQTPTSSKQKYRLTDRGRELQERLRQTQ